MYNALGSLEPSSDVEEHTVTFQAIAFGLVFLAQPHPPEWANIRLNRSLLRLEFGWLSPPRFHSGQAAEFEVHVYTDSGNYAQPEDDPLQKCFAQPPNGRDDNPGHASTDLPNSYTDVWNYWWPPASTIHSTLNQECGATFIRNLIGTLGGIPDMPDKIAQFTVSTRDPELLTARPEGYFFEYRLEVPSRVACLVREAGWAYVKLQMDVFSDTCRIGNYITDCPYLLGLEVLGACTTGRFPIQLWAGRICAPTNLISIPLVRDVLGSCVDYDDDYYFANQSVSMFGSHTGDCNDLPPNSPHQRPRLPEDCHDQLDNDCDGFRDLGDSDCAAVTCPECHRRSATACVPESDGVGCSGDGLSCTLDVCRGGSCHHEDTCSTPQFCAQTGMCDSRERCDPPTQSSPQPGATNVSVTPTLSWSQAWCAVEAAPDYRIQVHTSPTFPAVCNLTSSSDQNRCSSQIVINTTTRGSTQYTIPSAILTHGTTYYVRTRGLRPGTPPGFELQNSQTSIFFF